MIFDSEYGHIYEFEPDSDNCQKIYNRIEKEGIRDITVINKGVWSETKQLTFQADGISSSSISDVGNVTIDVIKLDDYYDQVTPNSLIKMDIEGSELEALKGAKRIIQDVHPTLAICVYHRIEDLITIPQYINDLVPENIYNYYLSYQGEDLAELVFYALPR